MRYLNVVLSCVLVLGLFVSADARQRETTGRDAELEEVLRLLVKSAELNPRDPTIYLYITQVFYLQFADRAARLDALIEQGKGSSTEASKILREIEQLEERHRTILERFRRMGAPIDLPVGPGGPVDAPPPPRTTAPDHPGR
jgi:hypothetical protein